MAQIAVEHELRLAVGECLLQLGDVVAADAVFGAVYRERNSAVARQQELSLERLREAALLGPGSRLAVD
jgi:hypothetical protein